MHSAWLVILREYNARLITLHVVPSLKGAYCQNGVDPINTQTIIDGNGTKSLKPPVASDYTLIVEQYVAEGDAATEIVRVAKEMSADVIIMGTHGQSGRSPFLMGTVAEDVQRKTPCPVLTLAGPADTEEES